MKKRRSLPLQTNQVDNNILKGETYLRCWAGLYVYAGGYINDQLKMSFLCVL